MGKKKSGNKTKPDQVFNDGAQRMQNQKDEMVGSPKKRKRKQENQ
jgi:hypothetical protein